MGPFKTCVTPDGGEVKLTKKVRKSDVGRGGGENGSQPKNMMPLATYSKKQDFASDILFE